MRAALEAAALVDACRDDTLREGLALIATDERRHSELAWRFVQWALGEHPVALRPALERLR